MTHRATMYITETDLNRLANLIESIRNQGDRAGLPYVRKLEDELKTQGRMA